MAETTYEGVPFAAVDGKVYVDLDNLIVRLTNIGTVLTMTSVAEGNRDMQLMALGLIDAVRALRKLHETARLELHFDGRLTDGDVD